MMVATLPGTDAAPPLVTTGSSDGVTAVETIEQELVRLFTRVRDVRRQSAARIHPDLQPAGFAVLGLLYPDTPLRASAIAEHLGVDRSAVSRLLRQLERLGLIARLPDAGDGRAHLVALSPEGVARLAALKADQQTLLRRTLDGWPAGDTERFAELLARFNDHRMDGHRDAPTR